MLFGHIHGKFISSKQCEQADAPYEDSAIFFVYESEVTQSILIRKIDDSINKALLWSTSTKSAFYALNILIIIAVITSPPTNIQGWLLVIVSEYYQGVALPGLGASAKKEAEETRRIMIENHEMAIEEIALLKQQNEKLNELISELHVVIKEMVKHDKEKAI